MELAARIDAIIVAWAASNGARLERRDDTWIIHVAGDLDGGMIGVVMRPNEHGPIEVAPSNDRGWFERWGCQPSALGPLLDASLKSLHEWVGREDPWQGMP